MDLVDAAIMVRRGDIDARRSRMVAKFADRVQEVLSSMENEQQHPQFRPDEAYPDDAFHDRELLQTTAVESKGKTASSVMGFVTDNVDQIPALKAQLTQEQMKVVQCVEAHLQRLDEHEDERKAWLRAKETAEVFGGEIPEEPARPTPPRLIVLGPGGTGKSFLIRVLMLLIRRWAQLRCLTRPSPQQGVILAAPTGVAAFNVGGSTLHSAFALKVEKKGKSKNDKLSGFQLAALREKLRNTQFLIVDEVSMVGSRILADVHYRLNQAMSTPEGYFGDLGVILLGDFFQLPPVRASYVFDLGSPFLRSPKGVHLYRDLFKPVFLTISQRQKGDLAFSKALRNARLGSLTPEDDILLQSRYISVTNNDRAKLLGQLTTDFADAPRLFWKNRTADNYNNQRIVELARDSGRPIVRMLAKDRGPGTVPLTEDPDLTGGLLGQLDVIVGMPVLLRSNIDVEDGLYNGARGHIAEIVPTTDSPTDPASVYIHFLDPNVGARAARKVISGRPAVQIAPISVNFEDSTHHQIKRTQLPLIPAFAFTIHKSQGLTLEKAVVDLEGALPPGMAYTALSRVRELEDLIIQHFHRSKFNACPKAIEEIARLNSILV